MDIIDRWGTSGNRERHILGGWALLFKRPDWRCLALALLIGLGPGCAVRRTTRISAAALPPPAQEASLADLVARINAQSKAIQTIAATVDLEPTAGSLYSGVIKEYHDVKSFILAARPAMIRMVGQAPVVRTDIFDMASDGEDFSLYIPSKQKFIVGKTAVLKAAKNPLENLRPQHILEALLIPPVESPLEKSFREEAEEGGRRYYVVDISEEDSRGDLNLRRKIWFDRSNLAIVRAQFYGPQGTYLEGVQYSDYHDFQGTRYPARIQVTRPVEDYGLSILVQKATFNQPIPPEKFELKKPDNAQRVELSLSEPRQPKRGEATHGW